MSHSEEKYLTFELSDEFYGFPILKVNEIIGLIDIVSIPKAPVFMKGIVNLRGKVIPIIDLRLKFGMEEREYDDQTCIIIVEITFSGEKKFVGIIVDRVAEVVSILDSEIEPPPQYGQKVEQSFITGIGKVKDKVVVLLDVEKIINNEDVLKLAMEEDA